ncbi:MAG: threonyl-tRNA synthetase editing domain-containing protein [Candidatus Hermodarchaeota archaeon]
MRFISFHCEFFKYKTTKRSRSKVFEELTDINKENSLDNLILLFISVEKKDEDNPKLIEKTVIEIEKIIKQIKVSNIVLLSFAHLFGDLSTPEFSLKILKELEDILKGRYNVLRPPFGWFNELEIKAKGHPLSRISRRIE